MSVIFHLSIPINDFATARKFYGEVLGCPEGRAEVDRIDFDFYGHHMVAQLSPEEAAHKSMEIGKESYPVRHFGAFVSREEFQRRGGEQALGQCGLIAMTAKPLKRFFQTGLL